MIRQRAELGKMMRERKRDLTFASVHGPFTVEQRRHAESCFFEGAVPDFETLFWSPRNMPTPFIGYMPQPGVHFGRHFNLQQLNMQGELPLPKPAGEFRVFLTGASVALGGGTATDEETIAALMQRELTPEFAARGLTLRVVCGAACGWCSTQERLLIENRLSEWEPDAVVALTGFNDMHWGYNKFNTLDGRSYDDYNFLLLANGGLRLAGEPPFSDVPPVRPESAVAPELVAQRFIKNLRLGAHALALHGVPYLVALQPMLSPGFKPLSDGEQLVYEQTAEQYPALLPHVEACYSAYRAGLFDAQGGLRAELAAAHPNLHVSDLRGIYAHEAAPQFLDFVHQGARGNTAIAKALSAELRAVLAAAHVSDTTTPTTPLETNR
jgi:hypothetical protein